MAACITGCPYKKVYFNHRTGKAEKCNLCYPRLEVGLPRSVGDLRRPPALPRALSLRRRPSGRGGGDRGSAGPVPRPSWISSLDPHDPQVQQQAARDGIPPDWLEAAGNSPVYKLAKVYKVALLLHPEYRTMPMVWYVPPLSPVVDALRETGHDAEDADNSSVRCAPCASLWSYLAEPLHRRGRWPVLRSLDTLAAMRSYMRDVNLGRRFRPEVPAAVGLTEESIYEMYQLLAIAKYEGSSVIPTAHAEVGRELDELACSARRGGEPGNTVPARSGGRPGARFRWRSRTSTR